MRGPVPAAKAIGRLVRGALAVAILACAAGAHGATPADQSSRAATIVGMLRFVDWPRSDAPHGVLRVAVVGNSMLATALREACADQQPGGRNVLILDVSSTEAANAAGAGVVIVGALPDREAERLLQGMERRGVLTVGDRDCPDNPHVMLKLVADGPRHRIRANPAAAARAGVNLSSRLLRLAQVVS